MWCYAGSRFCLQSPVTWPLRGRELADKDPLQTWREHVQARARRVWVLLVGLNHSDSTAGTRQRTWCVLRAAAATPAFACTGFKFRYQACADLEGCGHARTKGILCTPSLPLCHLTVSKVKNGAQGRDGLALSTPCQRHCTFLAQGWCSASFCRGVPVPTNVLTCEVVAWNFSRVIPVVADLMSLV